MLFLRIIIFIKHFIEKKCPFYIVPITDFKRVTNAEIVMRQTILKDTEYDFT